MKPQFPFLKRAVELDGENLMARFLLGRTYVSAHRSLLLGNFSKLALEQLNYVAGKTPASRHCTTISASSI